jgi:hypothetical protein
VRKAFGIGGVAGLAVILLAAGTLIARHPRPHQILAAKPVFRAPTNTANDPALLAALTRGGPPLPSPPPPTARVIPRPALSPPPETIDPGQVEIGPTPDDLDRAGAQRIGSVIENASGPADSDASTMPATD